MNVYYSSTPLLRKRQRDNKLIKIFETFTCDSDVREKLKKNEFITCEYKRVTYPELLTMNAKKVSSKDFDKMIWKIRCHNKDVKVVLDYDALFAPIAKYFPKDGDPVDNAASSK